MENRIKRNSCYRNHSIEKNCQKNLHNAEILIGTIKSHDANFFDKIKKPRNTNTHYRKPR